VTSRLADWLEDTLTLFTLHSSGDDDTRTRGVSVDVDVDVGSSLGDGEASLEVAGLCKCGNKFRI